MSPTSSISGTPSDEPGLRLLGPSGAGHGSRLRDGVGYRQSLRRGRSRSDAGRPQWQCLVGFTRSAALEYAPRAIRITTVCPGTIDTPMVSDLPREQEDAMAEIMKQQPIGRLGRADEIAAVVLWLCGPGASFVIGAALPVDGGFTAH